MSCDSRENEWVGDESGVVALRAQTATAAQQKPQEQQEQQLLRRGRRQGGGLKASGGEVQALKAAGLRE